MTYMVSWFDYSAAIGFAVGFALAYWLTERRWRENAQRVQRIESGGKLYKVLSAERHDWLLHIEDRERSSD